MSTDLPLYLQGFEALMQNKRKVLDGRLSQNRYEQFGEILDFDIEVSLLKKAPLDMRKFAGVIFDLEYNETAYRAFYRAYVLAYQAVDTLYPDEHIVTIDLTEYWDELAEADNMQAKLIEDTQEYLQQKPHIDEFINLYMLNMAPTGKYKCETEAICAMIFMLADRDICKRAQAMTTENSSE